MARSNIRLINGVKAVVERGASIGAEDAELGQTGAVTRDGGGVGAGGQGGDGADESSELHLEFI